MQVKESSFCLVVVVPGVRNTIDQTFPSRCIPQSTPATLTGCGQAPKHSTAPSPRKPCGGSRNAHTRFHTTGSRLGNAPWDRTAEGGTARACPTARVQVQALHPKVWRKATSPIPGRAASEAPRLPCGKPSCSRQDARPGNTDHRLKWLRLLAIFPYSQKWQSAIFYFLLIEPYGFSSETGSWEGHNTQPRE